MKKTTAAAMHISTTVLAIIRATTFECTATWGANSTKLPKSECVHVLKGLALPRESLRRDRPGGLTSHAFHACGSARLFRAYRRHISQKQAVFATLATTHK